MDVVDLAYYSFYFKLLVNLGQDTGIKDLFRFIVDNIQLP